MATLVHSALHREEDEFRAALLDLWAQDGWWDDVLALASQRPALSARAPWWKAVAAALVLHWLAFAATLFVSSESPSAISPGSGATMQVTILPAWPLPGDRTPRLGSVASNETMASATGGSTKFEAAFRSPPTAITTTPTEPRPQPSPLPENPPAQTLSNVQHQNPALADLPPSEPDPALNVWEHGVLEKLAVLKRYPASALRAGQRDTVMVRFVVDRAGKVLSAEIARSQGFAPLDDEARKLLLRASPLPALPSGAEEEMQFVIPIVFSLRR